MSIEILNDYYDVIQRVTEFKSHNQEQWLVEAYPQAVGNSLYNKNALLWPSGLVFTHLLMDPVYLSWEFCVMPVFNNKLILEV